MSESTRNIKTVIESVRDTGDKNHVLPENLHDQHPSYADILIGIQNLARSIAEVKESIVNSAKQPNDLLTTIEAAEYCRVTDEVILRWRQTGLPYLKEGKGFTFRRGELDRFMEGLKKKETPVSIHKFIPRRNHAHENL